MNKVPFYGKGAGGRRDTGGFSLVELLSVMAIMSVLFALGAPLATGSLRKAGDMNQAVLQISLLLEQARTYAMANNTYVWVGFSEDSENRRLTVSGVAGSTGSINDLEDASWRAVFKPQRFERILFDDGSGLVGLAEADDLADSNLLPYQLTVGGEQVTFRDVIRFGPMGDARVKAEEGSRWIQLGLKSAYRATGDPNVAALQVAGMTGQVRIFRR